ncbi:MAG: hypothetical protein NTW05_14820, partial [Pseudonocardiales bacterium]|nr:hypothetical protein [Pseudonocardiales bacterium]
RADAPGHREGDGAAGNGRRDHSGNGHGPNGAPADTAGPEDDPSTVDSTQRVSRPPAGESGD